MYYDSIQLRWVCCECNRKGCGFCIVTWCQVGKILYLSALLVLTSCRSCKIFPRIYQRNKVFTEADPGLSPVIQYHIGLLCCLLFSLHSDVTSEHGPSVMLHQGESDIWVMASSPAHRFFEHWPWHQQPPPRQNSQQSVIIF